MTVENIEEKTMRTNIEGFETNARIQEGNVHWWPQQYGLMGWNRLQRLMTWSVNSVSLPCTGMIAQDPSKATLPQFTFAENLASALNFRAFLGITVNRMRTMIEIFHFLQDTWSDAMQYIWTKIPAYTNTIQFVAKTMSAALVPCKFDVVKLLVGTGGRRI